MGIIKGGEALIWQGCKFTLNRKMANGKKYWRCAKRICPARITREGNEVLQQTLSGEQFFLRKEGEVLIFAMHTNMCLLAEATTIYVDGTFELLERETLTLISQLLDTVSLLLIFN